MPFRIVVGDEGRIVEIHRCIERDDYFALVNGPRFTVRWMLERHLAVLFRDTPRFTVPGFCSTCNLAVDFGGDFAGAWQAPDGVLVPNWRECLRCPSCRLNGRQRMATSLVAERIISAPRKDGLTVYLMEQASPVYEWLRGAFPWLDLVGSEYLGPDVPRGARRDGIRHEDAEHLSLADGSVDLFVSCDVFEHVDDPAQAFREAARVLRAGGEAVMTFPMDPHLDRNVPRARVVGGRVQEILPAVYHGNPLSPKGSLVFTDFGWDVLEQMRNAGLTDPSLNVYWSYEHGYLGIQFYFLAGRA